MQPRQEGSDGVGTRARFRWLARILAVLSLAFAVFMVTLSHLGPRLFGKTEELPGGTPKEVPLLLVLDVSGSMSIPDISGQVLRHLLAGQVPPSKMELARDAVVEVARGLPAGSVVGLRIFGDDTGLVVEPVAGGAAEILVKAPGLTVTGKGTRFVGPDYAKTDVGGGTAIHLALAAAGRDTQRSGRTGPWKWILVSDGLGNPAKSQEVARELAREFPDLSCDTINIGPETQELRDIAAILRGRHQAVPSGGLAQALKVAASLPSLAGFTGTPGSRTGVNPLATRAAEGTCFALVVLALLLRRRVKEGTYQVVMGALGGVLAWSVTELVLPTHGADRVWLAEVQNAAYFMVVGGILSTLLAASGSLWDGDGERALDRACFALPLGIALGAGAGWAGQGLFEILLTAKGLSLGVHFLARVAGWTMAGALVGGTVALAAGSPRRIRDGMLAGGLAGAASGTLFEILVTHLDLLGAPRFLALMLLSTSIAIAIRTLAEWRKVAWIEVVAGDRPGKRIPIETVECRIGTGVEVEVVVDPVPGRASGTLATVFRDGEGWWIRSETDAEILVNESATRSTAIRSGDRLRLGRTELEFHDRDLKVEPGVEPRV